jgi:hypothetical protein
MATYTELASIFGDDALRNKVEVACTVAAVKIRSEDSATANHANRLLWAKRTFTQPRPVAEQMLRVLIADNRQLTPAQIKGASDEAIQTAVDAAVNVFATGE